MAVLHNLLGDGGGVIVALRQSCINTSADDVTPDPSKRQPATEAEIRASPLPVAIAADLCAVRGLRLLGGDRVRMALADLLEFELFDSKRDTRERIGVRTRSLVGF